MEFSIEYGSRERIRTVALTTELNLTDVTNASDRLRSWAKVRGVEISGPVFLRACGSLRCRVHLPISSETMPHPETGIELDAVNGGEVARIHDVRLGELRPASKELESALGLSGPGTASEYHSVDGDFFSGDVMVVLGTPPKVRPASIALQSRAPVPAPSPDGVATLGEKVRVIAIARQHGTGGEAIADAVAKLLGFRLVGYEVFQNAAKQAGISPETLKAASVHRGVFSRILDGLSRSGSGYPEMWASPVALRDTPLFTSLEYRTFVENELQELARQGDVVILGHGAQLVLRDRRDTLRVLVTGSPNVRVGRAVAQGAEADEAEKAIRESDAERVDYFREFYDQGWLDPASYDLVINTDRTSVADAVSAIVHMTGRRSALPSESVDQPRSSLI